MGSDYATKKTNNTMKIIVDDAAEFTVYKSGCYRFTTKKLSDSTREKLEEGYAVIVNTKNVVLKKVGANYVAQLIDRKKYKWDKCNAVLKK